jgi:hypothetical protein
VATQDVAAVGGQVRVGFLGGYLQGGTMLNGDDDADDDAMLCAGHVGLPLFR